MPRKSTTKLVRAATNRLGQAWTVRPTAIEDTTPQLLIKILSTRPRIARYNLQPDGDITFSLRLALCGITHGEILRASSLRSRWFTDAAGEFLVMANLATFSDLVTHERYLQWARKSWHGGFGLSQGPFELQWQFHVTLLNRLFNESLQEELRKTSWWHGGKS